MFIFKRIHKAKDQCSLKCIRIQSFSKCPLLPKAKQRLSLRWQFPHSPLEGAHIFLFPKESSLWVLPPKFGAGVSFPHFVFDLGHLWSEPSGSLSPRNHPRPMQRLLACHYEEFFCSQNHSSFASDCFQHLPF